MSPEQPKASRTTAAMMAGNLLGELMAWQDRCDAAEADNAVLRARVAEQDAEIERLKKPPDDR